MGAFATRGRVEETMIFRVYPDLSEACWRKTDEK
jgi:hypothetical protein